MESFLGGKAGLCCGDSIHFMRDQPDNRYDSIVCDPPYALVSIVNRFGSDGAAPAKDGIYKRSSSGFMGKKWDTGESAHSADFWSECLRVLKPGGYVLAFAGTRTYHRLACAIEDAGFEIRDMISWLYGSGFPKSHDVSKGIDRAAGAEREVVGVDKYAARRPNGRGGNEVYGSDDRTEWQGWGTALKPACEPICMARKPLSEGTVAANVLKWGTGAINVDGCRVGTEDMSAQWDREWNSNTDEFGKCYDQSRRERGKSVPAGRWPANVIHDGSDAVTGNEPTGNGFSGHVYGYGGTATRKPCEPRDNGGSAARFFYTAKADSDDRLGSKHPTVKPVDLMQYLVRLVTSKGGLVLDPFAGTGTTAEACFREGMSCAMVEREPEYQADIRRRMALVMGGPDERRRESIKAKALPIDHGPLFSCG